MKEDRRAQTSLEILIILDSYGNALSCRDIENIWNLRHQTASARISELVDMGILARVGSAPGDGPDLPAHGLFTLTDEGARLMALSDARDALASVTAAYREACRFRAEAMRAEKRAIAQEVRRMARAALAEVLAC